MCTGAQDTCLVHVTPTTTNVLTYTRLWPSIVMSFDSIFQMSTILNWIYRLLWVVLRRKGCCFLILFTSESRVLPRLVCPWSYSKLQLRILIVVDNFECDVTRGSTFWWACCLALIWRVLPIKRVVSKCTLSSCAGIMSSIRYVFLSVCLSVRVCLSVMVCLSKSLRLWANALHYRVLDLHHVIHQVCLSGGLFVCPSLSICLCVQVYPSLSVRLCVLLCFYWTDIGESLRSQGHSLRQGTWGSRILTLHLNYVAGYTGPLLFLFERTHNYSVDNQGLLPWRLRRLGRSKVRSASLVRVLSDGKIPRARGPKVCVILHLPQLKQSNTFSFEKKRKKKRKPDGETPALVAFESYWTGILTSLYSSGSCW